MTVPIDYAVVQHVVNVSMSTAQSEVPIDTTTDIEGTWTRIFQLLLSYYNVTAFRDDGQGRKGKEDVVVTSVIH